VPIGILYWVIYVLWIVLGLYLGGFLWSGLVLAILLFLIGWKLFGFVVQ
jgi:hypothetical protein